MPTGGYSKTPLAKKLGLKDGFVVRVVNVPDDYWHLFTEIPTGLDLQTSPAGKKNFIHLFVTSTKELHSCLPKLKAELVDDGMLWVSWYKKSSGIKTDITEEIIRNMAIAVGLVDIKVCAIDEQWSGLKLVIPVKDRKQKE